MTTSAPLAFAFSHPSYTHEPCLSRVKEHDQGFNFERLNNIHELSLYRTSLIQEDVRFSRNVTMLFMI